MKNRCIVEEFFMENEGGIAERGWLDAKTENRGHVTAGSRAFSLGGRKFS